MKFYILILLLPIVELNEYKIKDNDDSYLMHEFIDIPERIFPLSFNISISFQVLYGRLSIYSIDRFRNQFIFNINTYKNRFVVILRGAQVISVPIVSTCNCKHFGQFEIMNISISIETKVTLRCNHGIIQNGTIPLKTRYIYGYPQYLDIEPGRMKNSLGNSAKLYIRQTLNLRLKYHLEACIFSLYYRNMSLSMSGGNKELVGCPRACRDKEDVCIGGQCVETYGELPTCIWFDKVSHFKIEPINTLHQTKSYLEIKLDRVLEHSFPLDFEIEFAINRSTKTLPIDQLLFYSLDKNNNQVYIETVHSDQEKLRIGKNGIYQDYTFEQLCNCSTKCYGYKQKLFIQPYGNKLSFQCNTYQVFSLIAPPELNHGFPIIEFSKASSTNQGIIWLWNIPKLNGGFQYGHEITGQIYNVLYKNNPIQIRSYGPSIQHFSSCKDDPNICNGGDCIPGYVVPTCDCTRVLKNGKLCNSESPLKGNNRKINHYFDLNEMKVSWKIPRIEGVFAIIYGKHLEMKLFVENNNLKLILNNDGFKYSNILLRNYKPNDVYIILFTMISNIMTIKMPTNNRKWHLTISQLSITSCELYGQDGFIDVATRRYSEKEWKIIKNIEQILPLYKTTRINSINTTKSTAISTTSIKQKSTQQTQSNMITTKIRINEENDKFKAKSEKVVYTKEGGTSKSLMIFVIIVLFFVLVIFIGMMFLWCWKNGTWVRQHFVMWTSFGRSSNVQKTYVSNELNNHNSNREDLIQDEIEEKSFLEIDNAPV